MMEERLELSIQRIREIENQNEVSEEYQDYFNQVSRFLILIFETYQKSLVKELFLTTLEEKQKINQELYRELIQENYESSYLNPTYAVKKLGQDYGQIMSAVYAQLFSLIPFAFECNLFQIVIHYEFFLEIFFMFVTAFEEDESIPKYEFIKETYSSFSFDYLDDFMKENVRNLFTTDNKFALDIVNCCDLKNVEYLYYYGEYISKNEIDMTRFMAELSQEKIDLIANTFTEGYRLGFLATGKDITIKKTVTIRYFLGFERVVKAAISNFEKMGLKTILMRSQPSFIMGRSLAKNGYYSTILNKQFECDHEYDKVLYFNSKYITRKIEAYKAALLYYSKEAALYGGPAVIESFGENPFSPLSKKENIRPSITEQRLFVEYSSKAGELLNQYVKGEERSFTIIAFPIPEIGNNFCDIFEEVIRINTLDYQKYLDIQQTLIDTLDKAKYIRVKGREKNCTDLQVSLHTLLNPEKETIFENCVADVNIPVGEVFTSPRLQGTNGILNVSEVFLNGLQYKNLTIQFKDGMITDYTCSNFDNDNEGKEYIKDHILHQHDTLPMGEFAIGTNTVAYMVSKRYKIADVMPILIAEKTGPHFAVGDTCYSHEEDIMTYNPDGKAIVARQNDISALRTTDITKAYFNCHTDITIPYDELGELTAVGNDGTEYVIIQNGRFVLNGIEELNKPFDE